MRLGTSPEEPTKIARIPLKSLVVASAWKHLAMAVASGYAIFCTVEVPHPVTPIVWCSIWWAENGAVDHQ